MSTLGEQRFQTVPFSNRSTLESVFELIRFRYRFRHCSVDGSRIRNKTVLGGGGGVETISSRQDV